MRAFSLLNLVKITLQEVLEVPLEVLEVVLEVVPILLARRCVFLLRSRNGMAGGGVFRNESPPLPYLGEEASPCRRPGIAY